MTSPDLKAMREAAENATPARIGGDRPAKDPGGCYCQLCGTVFVGEAFHTTCEGCTALETFQRLWSPANALALLDRLEEVERERDEAVSIVGFADLQAAIRATKPLASDEIEALQEKWPQVVRTMLQAERDQQAALSLLDKVEKALEPLARATELQDEGLSVAISRDDGTVLVDDEAFRAARQLLEELRR